MPDELQELVTVVEQVQATGLSDGLQANRLGPIVEPVQTVGLSDGPQELPDGLQELVVGMLSKSAQKQVATPVLTEITEGAQITQANVISLTGDADRVLGDTAIQSGLPSDLLGVEIGVPTVDVRQDSDNARKDTDGRVIDLNVGCVSDDRDLAIDHMLPQEVQSRDPKCRLVFGQADHRPNKVDGDQQKHKNVARGVSRFAIPFKKSLLCTPLAKPKTVTAKKCSKNDALRVPRKQLKEKNMTSLGLSPDDCNSPEILTV